MALSTSTENQGWMFRLMDEWDQGPLHTRCCSRPWEGSIIQWWWDMDMVAFASLQPLESTIHKLCVYHNVCARVGLLSMHPQLGCTVLNLGIAHYRPQELKLCWCWRDGCSGSYVFGACRCLLCLEQASNAHLGECGLWHRLMWGFPVLCGNWWGCFHLVLALDGLSVVFPQQCDYVASDVHVSVVFVLLRFLPGIFQL